jgi:quinol monooxygenase YgiN
MAGRREVVVGGLALALLGPTAARAQAGTSYGLIGRIRSVPGKRADLAAILLGGTGSMPGCRAYIVAEDAKDADALWITEVWDDAAAHAASLRLPAVQDAIRRGRPLIAGFDSRVELKPLGGWELDRG